MRKIVTMLIATLCLLAASAAFGQGTTSTAPSSSEPLDQQIQKLKWQLKLHRDLLVEAAGQIDQLRAVGSEQADQAERAFQEQQQQIETLERALKSQQDLADRQIASEQRLRKILWGGTVAFAVCIITVVFLVLRRTYNAGTEDEQEQTLGQYLKTPAPQESRAKTETLTDPKKEDVERWALRHGNPLRVPFTLTLPKEELSFDCEAERRPGMDPKVHFKGETRTATWKERRLAAAKLAAIKAPSL